MADISEQVDGSLDALVEFVVTVGTAILGLSATLIGALAAVTFGIVLSLVLAFFMLRDASAGWRSLIRPLSSWRQTELTRVATQLTNVTGDYMAGRPSWPCSGP